MVAKHLSDSVASVSYVISNLILECFEEYSLRMQRYKNTYKDITRACGTRFPECVERSIVHIRRSLGIIVTSFEKLSGALQNQWELAQLSESSQRGATVMFAWGCYPRIRPVLS